MSEQPVLTAKGAEKLRKELEQLKGQSREDLAERLHAAIEMGDLSENADYAAAKEEQGFLEGRIQELEYLLSNAVIVEENDGPYDIVAVGAQVTVQEADYPEETYLLVGAKEADPRNGKISNESPIGKALIGHKEGETISAVTPGGERHLKILKIE